MDPIILDLLERIAKLHGWKGLTLVSYSGYGYLEMGTMSSIFTPDALEFVDLLQASMISRGVLTIRQVLSDTDVILRIVLLHNGQWKSIPPSKELLMVFPDPTVNYALLDNEVPS